MSFCFNFSDDENDQQNDDTNTVEVIQQTFTSSKLKAQDSDIITESGEFDPVKDALFEQHQQQKNISKHTEYTDVIHGVYEGGLKLWECSDDLLQYLSQDLPQEGFVGRRVVDLGCGHGHPGIWCVSRGSALTCFQDLNTDALRQATVPNVLRICGSDCIIKKNHTNATTAGSIVAGEGTASTTQNEDLGRLQALMTKKVASKKTAQLTSNADTLQYEKIKALVLSGEETDPEMIQWVLEVEEELFGDEDAEADGADAVEDEDDEDEDDEVLVDDGEDEEMKKTKLKNVVKSNVVLNTGYSTPDYTLTPHATFIYGPWGYYDLEKSSLLNNHYNIQNKTTEDASTAAATTPAQQEVIDTLVADVIQHYNAPTEAKKFTTTLAYDTVADQVTTQPSTEVSTNAMTMSISITPSTIVIEDISLPHKEQLDVEKNKETTKKLLDFLLTLTTTINTTYSQALNAYRAESITKQHYTYPYTTPTIHFVDENNQQFPFTTIISTTLQNDAQRGLFSVFTDAQFVEASWLKTAQPEATKEEGEEEQQDKINITMCSAITSKDTTTTATTTPQIDIQQLENNLAYIYTTTNPTKTTKKRQSLWFGSHPLDSPYRYDIILSSDTIYSSPTMPTLIQTLRSMLSRNGKAYIAAKRYYFGVGGGTPEFCQHIETHCPDMKIRSVKQFINGASNIREILLLEWDQDAVQNVW